MKITLPKSARGTRFQQLMPIELNDFIIEHVLTRLFYRLRSDGRAPLGSTANNAVSVYVENFINHPKIEGLNNSDGATLAEGWLRAGYLRLGRIGEAHRDEQVIGLEPLHLLAYRAQFRESARARNIDSFLYQALVDAVQTTTHPGHHLQEIAKAAFGSGVKFQVGSEYGANVNTDEIGDTETLALIYLLDSISWPTASQKPTSLRGTPSLDPAAEAQLGADLLNFLRVHQRRLPPRALIGYLTSLIMFSLYTYVQRIAEATLALEKKEQRLAGSPPPIYVDLTGERNSTSWEMARTTVEWDLNRLGRYHYAALFVRTLHRFALADRKASARLCNNPDQFWTHLVHLSTDPDIRAAARVEWQAILEANDCDPDRVEMCPNADLAQILRVLNHSTWGDVERTARLLAEAQKANAQKALGNFMRTAGEADRGHGLLHGHDRRGWRHGFGSRLLWVLVQMSTLPTSAGMPLHPQPIALPELLERLRTRYGLYIAQPPPELASPETRQAAQTNLESFRERLRQMGFLDQLSDDFELQTVIPQFSGLEEVGAR